MFQIELSKHYGSIEWKEDLKKTMLSAGVNRSPVVFFFSDTQVFSIFIVFLRFFYKFFMAPK